MWEINEARDRFLDHCRVGRSLSANTLKAYTADLADFTGFIGGERRIGKVGRDRLRDYARWLLDERHLKEASVKRRIAALKVFFRWLEREEAVTITPFHRLDLVVRLPRRLPRGVSAEELKCLLDAIGGEADGYGALLLRLTVTLLFTTGLRIGELAAVRLGDIDTVEGVIQVRGKGNRERRVYLVGREPKRLLERFLAMRRRLKSPAEELLLTPGGQPATPQYLRRRLIRAGKAAGLSRRITPHMLRHAAATHLVEAGVDIRFVQKLLGHASIATTQIYTQVSDNSLKEALSKADTLGRLEGKRGR
jgi:integrase/recombinase XerD